MKIGLLGGTFNPIHLGHIHIAEEVYKKLGLDKIIFMPTNIPPHKSIEYNIDSKIRYDMVEKCIKKYPEFEISDIEIKREGCSYTIDTLKELKKQTNADLYLIIGLDQFLEFDTWKYYQHIFLCSTVVVVKRADIFCPEQDKEEIAGNYLKKVIFFDNKIFDISSTEIRNKVKTKKDISKFVPKEILQQVKDIYKEGYYE